MSTSSPPANALSTMSLTSLVGPESRILWQNTTTGERSIWIMSGTSYSSAVILQTVPIAWSIAGSGDFDGNGSADILWQNLTTGDRSIWLMNGNSYSSAVLLQNVPVQWSIAGVGDFDGDGKPDIVWQNLTTGDRSLWYMNGTVYRSAALLPRVPIEWKIVAVGDFDGNGKPDLVWQKPTTGENSIWFMNGSTSIGVALLSSVPPAWRIAGAGDFDGNGRPDLLWQNVATGERSIWLMNGTTVLGAAILQTVPIQWSMAGVMAAAALPPPLTPAAPTGLTALGTSATTISLTWQDNSNNETGFKVEQCGGAACTNFVELSPAVGANNTAANVGGLSPAITYRYRIRAYNGNGNSDYSNIASATTGNVLTVFASADNTVAFSTNDATIANKVYTGGDWAVGCSYSIGLYVSDSFCNEGLLRFDGATAVIAGRQIASAILEIKPDLLPADLGTVYAMNAIGQPWSPSSVTFNNQPQYFTYAEQHFYPPASTLLLQFNVTTWVQLWALGPTNGGWANNGIMIRDTSVGFPSISLVQTTYFQSLENFSAQNNRPHLIITFQ